MVLITAGPAPCNHVCMDGVKIVSERCHQPTVHISTCNAVLAT